MKTKILVAALAAGMVAAPSAQAAVEVSGQVNVAALFGSAPDDLTVVDNNTTGTRVRFKANKKFGGGFKIGSNFELQAQFNQSNDAGEIGGNGANNISEEALTNGPFREVRIANVWLSGAFGKVGIGRGNGAANGTAEAVGLLNFLGGNEAHLLFNGVGTDFSDVDGNSRTNRVRYDSPNWSGFRFAVTLNSGDEQELGLFYDKKGSFGKVRVRAGFTTGEGDESTVDFSVAWKSSFGLGLNYSTGERDVANGITTTENDWFLASWHFGKHYLISIGRGEETERSSETGAQEGGENEFTLLSAVWKPVDGAEIYLNYGDWTNNVIADENDDSNAFGLGARFKF